MSLRSKKRGISLSPILISLVDLATPNCGTCRLFTHFNVALQIYFLSVHTFDRKPTIMSTKINGLLVFDQARFLKRLQCVRRWKKHFVAQVRKGGKLRGSGVCQRAVWLFASPFGLRMPESFYHHDGAGVMGSRVPSVLLAQPDLLRRDGFKLSRARTNSSSGALWRSERRCYHDEI